MIGKWHLGTNRTSKTEVYFRNNNGRWQYISVDGKSGAVLDAETAKQQLVSHRGNDGKVLLADSQTAPDRLVSQFYGA